MNISQKPAVLSISAHDPLGMSGVAMDQRALSVLDIHCASCITANTAQNQFDFFRVNATSLEVFKNQLDALHQQDIFSVIKIGFMPNLELAKCLIEHEIFQDKAIIYDPVLAMSSEGEVSDDERLAAALLLLPKVTMLTPNFIEATALLHFLGVKNCHSISPLQMGEIFLQKGVQHIYIKGGHSEAPTQDLYLSNERYFYLNHERFGHGMNRGTGCAMASLIAGAHALHYNFADAAVIAKTIMHQGWQQPYALDDATGGFNFDQIERFSVLLSKEESATSYSLPNLYREVVEQDFDFPRCESELGLYPIVDRAVWLQRLLPLGVKIAQLRIKDLSGDALKTEIKNAVAIAERYACQLFINDFWQLAIECGAYGVHLGQEDIDDADLRAIQDAGLRLGLSSHCFYEVTRAKTIQPSYIAFGPVYATQTKEMPWTPQGAKGLNIWRKLLQDFPMVAIGGIHDERFEHVKAMGVDSIAMVSAIIQAGDPEAECESYLSRWRQ